MPRVVKTETVPTLGVGKPDYAREMWLGRIYTGIELKYNEMLKLFQITMSDIASPAPYVRGPLAPGDVVSLVDVSTGLPMPYTIAVGRTLRVLSNHWSFNRVGQSINYFEGVFVGTAFPESLGTFLNQPVAPLDTSFIDPTAASSHTMQFTLKNIDTENLEGFWIYAALERIIGSEPFPKDKTVKCKWCEATDTVPAETTWYTCKKCGKKTWFYPLITRG